MASQIQLRRDTAANWTSANPTLALGELGYDTTNNKIKMGDGTTAWGSLAYFTGPISAAVLNDLSDVTITSAANGDFLRWNGTAWINDAVNLGTDTAGSFVESLVAGTGISLTNNSGEAATPTVSLNATLDNLTDVVVSSPLQFQGLMYDGTNWVNSNIPNTYLVRNNTGSTLLKGTLVGAVGAEPSGRIDVAPFEVTGGQDSELRAMGIVVSNISDGVNGEVISFGTLTGLDTRGSTASALAVGDETWAAGDILFAHPTVDGKLTNVRPQHDLAVAFITVLHASTGQIAIRIIPGNNHLEWMHDVSLVDKTSGDFLKYNGTLWVNDQINLGTDTTGNYVNDVTAGTGVTVTHTPGEGSSPTVAIGQSVATSASPTFANVTISSVPTNDNHAATKAYVDYHAAGIVWHDAVRLATAAVLPGTPTYDNGTSGVGATLTAASNARLMIDGTNATTNDRVLVKDQANAAQNGVYKVTAQGSASAPYVLTRAADFDASPGFENIGATGNAVYVTSGAYNPNQGFITLSTGTGAGGVYVLGTDDITFGQFTGTATFIAGNGVTITGNTINVETANAGRIVVGGDSIDLALVTRSDTSGSAGKSFIQSFTTDSYGRVTGSVTADTAIALGTDTSGNYVANLTAGTGITLSGNSGEGATPTVAVTANTYDAYGAAATAQTNAESTASGYVSTHAALTTTHGVSGAIVGTSDAQTLTNKTLTSPNVDGSGVIFEGATANDFETTVTVTDPTADRTITFPDATGTVALTSDITSAVDAITTTAIEEGTNQYFTDERAQDAVGNAVGTGLTYTDSTGAISVTANTYDAYGAAATAQTNAESTASGYVSTHAALTTTHGVSGAIVGTSDAQTLTNKTLTSPNINENVALTATATELNVLDGATLSTTELNYVDGVTSAIQTQIDTKAPTASPTFTGTVTLAADPGSALQAATKQYVDNFVSGVNFHASVVAATSGNLAGTYNNGTSGVGATITKASNGSIGTIDGATVVVGSRILVKSQTDPKENGIYAVTAVGSVSAPWVVTRATDADNNPAGEMANGDFCFVTGGSTSAGYGYINNSTASPIVIGTDDITYAVFNAAQVVTGGAGLAFDGNILNVGTASTGRIVVNADNIDLASNIATTGTYKSVTVDTYGRVTAGTNPTTLSGYGITDAAPINNASFTGTFSAPTGTITSTMLAGDIALSKLATSTAGNIIVYNSSGVPTAVTETGDVTISDTGVASISTGVIVNADVSTTAAIDLGKLADISTNAQTASYTLVLADKNKLVEMSVGSGNTLTVPPNSSVAFPVGSQIRVLQTNTGQCTITPGAGVTINGTPGLKLRTQWASATLIKRATDTWVAVGDLSA